eukprot:COSAG03_NODE_25520_length_265_cov_0.614458_2_plen_49_part_01
MVSQKWGGRSQLTARVCPSPFPLPPSPLSAAYGRYGEDWLSVVRAVSNH